MMIAFPPCTYLCNSGVRWLFTKDAAANKARWMKMADAVDFFNVLWLSKIPRIAMENPIMHKWAKHLLIPQRAQLIQPWQFGHGETKATGLYLKNLPRLTPTNIVEGREARIHKMAPGPNRGRERSRTYEGIAQAMAQQWGSLDTSKPGAKG